MNLDLRFVEERDAEKLLAVYAPYITDTAITFEYDVPTPAEFAARIAGITQRYPWLVCEADGELAGYAYASPHLSRAAFQWDAELSIYVRPEYQRRGAATRLYRALIALLSEQGYYNLYARISVPNENSEAFHRAMGFSPVGVYPRTGYKLGAWRDMAVMELPLRGDFDEPRPAKTIRELEPARVRELLMPQEMLRRP